MSFAPIVLFVYNRLGHTRKTLEALQQNSLASQSELIIFSDGPKDQETSGKVEEIRQYLKTIRGFKQVYIRERKENQGLAKSIIDGVTEIVNEYGKVIVLEDDLVTSPFFLKYMNEALDLYENDDRVVSIHGYVYPVKSSLPETFFIKGANCWGWATWKHSWDLLERDGSVLLKRLMDQRLTGAFDFNGSYPYTEMLKAQISGKNNSWAVRWYASAFLANKLTLYPRSSLVCNIGNEGSGTHCGSSNLLDVQLAQAPIVLKEIEVSENKGARQAFEGFFRTMQGSFVSHLIGKFKKLLRRCWGRYAGV